MKIKNDGLLEILKQLEEESSVDKDSLFDILKKTLINVYKKQFNADNCKINLNLKTGKYDILSVKTVVSKVKNSVLEVSLREAKKYDKKAVIGAKVKVPVNLKKFKRTDILVAKQQIPEKLREKERITIINKFKNKQNRIITGEIFKIIRNTILVNFGKIKGVLLKKDQIIGEYYKQGDRIKAYVVDIINDKKNVNLMLSRTDKNFVKNLLEKEVPEITNGIVEIKAIARRPGVRSKIAVISKDENVDPIGACIGENKSRIDLVIDELKGEKIDIIKWDDNPAILIENALNPAKVILVSADPEEKKAKVVVPDYQLSLAIGSKGLNVSLVAQLSDFKINIKSESQAIEDGDIPEEYVTQKNL